MIPIWNNKVATGIVRNLYWTSMLTFTYKKSTFDFLRINRDFESLYEEIEKYTTAYFLFKDIGKNGFHFHCYVCSKKPMALAKVIRLPFEGYINWDWLNNPYYFCKHVSSKETLSKEQALDKYWKKIGVTGLSEPRFRSVIGGTPFPFDSFDKSFFKQMDRPLYWRKKAGFVAVGEASKILEAERVIFGDAKGRPCQAGVLFDSKGKTYGFFPMLDQARLWLFGLVSDAEIIQIPEYYIGPSMAVFAIKNRLFTGHFHARRGTIVFHQNSVKTIKRRLAFADYKTTKWVKRGKRGWIGIGGKNVICKIGETKLCIKEKKDLFYFRNDEELNALILLLNNWGDNVSDRVF